MTDDGKLKHIRQICNELSGEVASVDEASPEIEPEDDDEYITILEEEIAVKDASLADLENNVLPDLRAKVEAHRQRLVELESKGQRKRLPDERQALTHHFVIHSLDEDGKPMDHDGYLTMGFYEDGTLGEIFLKMHRQGGTVSGFCDSWALAMSLLLQHGVALTDLCRKYKNMRFEPSGRTNNEVVSMALSPVDYVAKYLEGRFVEMKALSFLQPWLYAMLHLDKNVENRTWAPPINMMGKVFALHASKGWDKYGEKFLADRALNDKVMMRALYDMDKSSLPRGAIVGTARLVAWAHYDSLKLVKDERTILESPWFFGPYGWLLEDIKAIEPIPCKGALGFWEVPKEIKL